MYFGIWYGGQGYSQGDRDMDLERFNSLEDAKNCLRQRRNGDYQQCAFAFINRNPEVVYCPLVENDSEIWLWYAGDSKVVEQWTNDGVVSVPEYPHKRVFFGPRGGVKVEDC